MSKRNIGKKKYTLPIESEINYNVENYFAHPPNTKSWAHGKQEDDILNSAAQRRKQTIAKLKTLINYEQRSPEWFAQRERMITASDIGTAIGENHHEHQYKVVQKKIMDIPFNGQKSCYHGKKYENTAAMIYGYRMNVQLREYGCIEHKCGFLGASPDRIIDEKKLDGIHDTKLVGRMVEIKCVDTRKINMTSDNVFDIIPAYYYPQPHIQMQCCDLDECDFSQFDIKEYASREEFIDDTDPNEPFRSKTTGNEKGVIIQLLPYKRTYDNRDEEIWNCAKFVYPPSITMTPYDCDKWVSDVISGYKNNKEYKDYVIDNVIYWKLNLCRVVTVKRDDNWFSKNYPILKKIWSYVTYLRENEDKKIITIEYIKFAEEKYKHNPSRLNDIVMFAIARICDAKNPDYKNNINMIKKEIGLTDEDIKLKIANGKNKICNQEKQIAHDNDDAIDKKNNQQKQIDRNANKNKSHDKTQNTKCSNKQSSYDKLFAEDTEYIY